MKVQPLHIDLLSYADSLTLRTVKEDIYVHDPCRKKYVKLEPEEFVRQLIIIYLHDKLKVGYGRMITERKLDNYQQNRFDLGVRDTSGNWTLLVECKSFRQPLHQDAVIQLTKYNDQLGAIMGMVSNGKDSYLWAFDKEASFITEDSDLIGRI